MVAILTSNRLKTRDNRAPAPAVKTDGSNYPYRMFYDNNQRIVDADTPAEILDVLIADYSLLEPDTQRQARRELASAVQLAARGTVLARLSDEESDALADWEWDVLEYGDASSPDPFGWGDGTGTLGTLNADVTDLWSSAVPLVLQESSYAPFTEVPAPVSNEGDYREVKNLIWLRPETELGLLRSLSRIGYVAFGQPYATEIGE